MKVARLVVGASMLALLLAPVGSVGAAGRGAGDGAAGGGYRLLGGERIAEFELGASSAADGSGAHGSYYFNRDGTWFSATVTCLRVDTERAVVGGRVTDGNVDGAQGFLVWLDDGGIPSGGQPGPDLVSFSLISPLDPLWPAGIADVPTTCPSTDLPDGVEWRAVEGSVTVTDR